MMLRFYYHVTITIKFKTRKSQCENLSCRQRQTFNEFKEILKVIKVNDTKVGIFPDFSLLSFDSTTLLDLHTFYVSLEKNVG